MASTREIRRRIRSVKNIGQITRAMELVAAAKMRRAQDMALAGRSYNQTMYVMLEQLLRRVDNRRYRLLQQPDDAQTAVAPLVVMFGPSRGLVGSLPFNLIREVSNFIDQHPNSRLVTMGKRTRDGVLKLHRDIELVADFPLRERPRLGDILSLSRLVMDEYMQGRSDRVYIANTQFINTMQQQPQISGLLPLTPELLRVDYLSDDEDDDERDVEYLLEPSVDALVEQLLPRFVEMTIYQALLEALASEYSAQMIAMRNASDNAKDLQDELTLTYNQLRQASITAELAEIAAGSGA